MELLRGNCLVMVLGIFLCSLSVSFHSLLEGFGLFSEGEECEFDCVEILSILLVMICDNEVVAMGCEIVCNSLISWCSFLLEFSKGVVGRGDPAELVIGDG